MYLYVLRFCCMGKCLDNIHFFHVLKDVCHWPLVLIVEVDTNHRSIQSCLKCQNNVWSDPDGDCGFSDWLLAAFRSPFIPLPFQNAFWNAFWKEYVRVWQFRKETCVIGYLEQVVKLNHHIKPEGAGECTPLTQNTVLCLCWLFCEISQTAFVVNENQNHQPGYNCGIYTWEMLDTHGHVNR